MTLYTDVDGNVGMIPLLSSCSQDHSQPFQSKNEAPLRLLLIDDDEKYTAELYEHGSLYGFEIRAIGDYADLTSLEYEEFDIAVVNLDLHPTGNLKIIEAIFELFGPIPVVMVSSSDQVPEQRSSSEVFEVIPKSLGVEAILDAAMDAYEWWNLDYA